MPLLILGRIDVESDTLLKESTEPLKDAAVQIDVILFIENLVQARNAQRKSDRPVGVSTQILDETVKFAVVRDHHVASHGAQHVDAIQEILQVDPTAAHQILHRDLKQDFGLLPLQVILHEEHGVGAFHHVVGHVGNGTETSTLHQKWLVVKSVGGLHHLPVGTE